MTKVYYLKLEKFPPTTQLEKLILMMFFFGSQIINFYENSTINSFKRSQKKSLSKG